MAGTWSCRICHNPISKDADPSTYILQGPFHIHKECYTRGEKDRDDFYHYCEKLFGDDFDFVKIARTAEGYVTAYKYTFSGMLGSLIYFYDVQKHTTEQAHGSIGIIPYIYKDAKAYWDRIEQAKERNKNQKEYKAEQKTVTIPTPEINTRPPRIFSMED